MSVKGTPDFMYYVFDLYGHNGDYRERLNALRFYIQDYGLDNVSILPQIWVSNEDELLKYETLCLSQGYEGIMLRRVNSLYKYGRSTVREGYLLKRKPLADAEAEIIGYAYLERNYNVATTDALGHTKRSTSRENKIVDRDFIGTIAVKVLNGPFEGVEVNIGTGFTEAQRQEFALAPEELFGKIVNFSYQLEGSKDRPRFPSFKGFRDPEDMS